jgi:hypothetical protein
MIMVASQQPNQRTTVGEEQQVKKKSIIGYSVIGALVVLVGIVISVGVNNRQEDLITPNVRRSLVAANNDISELWSGSGSAYSMQKTNFDAKVNIELAKSEARTREDRYLNSLMLLAFDSPKLGGGDYGRDLKNSDQICWGIYKNLLQTSPNDKASIADAKKDAESCAARNKSTAEETSRISIEDINTARKELGLPELK